MFTDVHRDTPPSPHVVHKVIHRGVLTRQSAWPSFARQESPGSGSHVASGEGGRTARSGASGRAPPPPRPGGPGPPCQRVGRAIAPGHIIAGRTLIRGIAPYVVGFSRPD